MIWEKGWKLSYNQPMDVKNKIGKRLKEVREERGMNMEAARGELANLPALEAQYGEQLEAFDEAFEAALGSLADADLLAQYRGAGKNVKDSLGEIRQGLTRSVRLVKNSL